MTAETALKFKALEAQANTLFETFVQAGYEPVAPAVLQPADVFLNQIGESLRSRTYVFTAPDGEELCLRPDLTVPISRLYLERHPEAGATARYCYNGSTFRFQPEGRDAARPREFRQAGIENIGFGDAEKIEADVINLTREALRACGLNTYQIRFGDLALFQALIDALDIPMRWQMRLKHQFWQPTAFHDLLSQLTSETNTYMSTDANAVLLKLRDVDDEAARDVVSSFLEDKTIPLVGTRSLDEITARLLDQREDIKCEPLSGDIARIIENYLAISGPPKAATARIEDLARAAQINLDDALHTYTRRLDMFADAKISLEETTFHAEFGRNLEYYTGLVFQFEIPDLAFPAGYIAGGGRYDNLIGDISGGYNASAIGSAIHTERLLLAVEGALDE